MKPVFGLVGKGIGRLVTMAKGGQQAATVATGALSGRGYTATQIANLFRGNTDDAYKVIFRGMTGSQSGSGALFLADDAAYAASYAKNGGQLAAFKIPAQNFQLMLQEKLIGTLNGVNAVTGEKGLEYIITNPAVKQALLNSILP